MLKRLMVVLCAGLGASAIFVAPAARAQNFAYCKADAERLCAGIQPGGGRLAKCLKAHENEVSIGCGKEIKKLKSQMEK
jgi:hypothetical protein